MASKERYEQLVNSIKEKLNVMSLPVNDFDTEQIRCNQSGHYYWSIVLNYNIPQNWASQNSETIKSFFSDLASNEDIKAFVEWAEKDFK